MKTVAEKLFDRIKSQLADGGFVRLATQYRCVDYKANHAEMFSIGKDGCLYVQRGKSRDCIAYPSMALVCVRFYSVGKGFEDKSAVA